MITLILGTLLLGAFFIPVASFPDAGDLRWEDQAGLEFIDVSSFGNDVAVAGVGGDPMSPSFLVRTYDSRSGALLWQDELVQVGGSVVARAIAQTGGQVFAVGNTSPDMRYTSSRFLVRAYESNTGHLLWEERFDDGNRSIATNVVASGHRVFVGGFSESEQFDFDSVLRAYDADTGALSWEDRIEESGVPNALPLAIDGNRLFAAGVAEGSRGDGDFMVRAYNATTGELLWKNQVDGSGVYDAASAVTASQGQVSVVGVGRYAFTVRTYRARDGALLWQDVFAPPEGSAEAFSVTSAQGRIFAVGAAFEVIPGGPQFVIRAYDSGTGSLLWEDQFDGGGNAQAFNVVATGNRVVTVGSAGEGAYQDFIVRAYDARTGNLVWNDRLDTGGGALGLSIAAEGGCVFAAGMHGNGVSSGGLVRAFEAR